MRAVRVGIGGLGATIAALAFSAPASAVVTASQITTPSDPAYMLYDSDNPSDPANTFTISGTTTGSGSVDIVCYVGSNPTTASPLVSNVTVTNNAFSTTYTLGTLAGDRDRTCTLRAIPSGTTPADLTPFAGPRLGIGSFFSSDFSSGPAAGDPFDFVIDGNLLSGRADFRSLSSGGMFDAYPIDPGTQQEGGDLFFDNDSFPVFPGQSRSPVQVDGVNAFGSHAVEALCGLSCAVPGIPPLTFSHTLNTASGDVVIHESEPLVKCSPDSTTYPSTIPASGCTSLVLDGVTVSRTIELYANGRQASLITHWSSTDGKAHNLDLISSEDASQANAGYDFPWVDGSTYKTHSAGDSEPAPASTPASVYVAYDNTLLDGDETGAQGAITFGTKPNGFAFAAHGAQGSTHLTALYTRTVPASGSLTLTQIYSWAFTKADAQTLASDAQFSLAPPTVAITGPANGTPYTFSPITVLGTESASAGQGGLASLMVNGQSVTPNPDGTWSAEVPVTPGWNTITAVVTDGNGEQATTQVTVYARLALTLVGEKFKGKAVLVTITCSTVANCAGKIRLTYTHTVATLKHGKRHHHKVTIVVGSANYSIAAGQTATVTVTLNGKGKKLLATLGKLPITGTVTAGGATAATFNLTLKPPKKHKHKHL